MDEDKLKVEKGTIDWILKASVEEIIKRAFMENWSDKAFHRWLNVKKIQYLEQIARRK